MTAAKNRKPSFLSKMPKTKT